MNHSRISHLSLYVGLVGSAFVLLLLILKLGPSDVATAQSQAASSLDWMQVIGQEFKRNLDHPLSNLLLQILLILSACRACGWVARRFGQPQVVGEMIAGILIGKSVFAQFWPEGFQFIFPDASMPRLYILSQVGLIFFMFVVGLELKGDHLRKRASSAFLVSHVSILLPFLLGAGAALLIYDAYAPPGVAFVSFALFMGISMSITAFPVLARILKERNMMETHLGSVAIACAAVDDVTAWCILAAVIGIVKAGTVGVAVVMILLALIYVLAMLRLVRPFLARVLKVNEMTDGFRRAHFAIVFVVVLGSAMIAEVIGIHALFGAFLAGFIMPQNVNFRTHLAERVEDLSAVVFLPLFFTYTGIRMEMGVIDSPDDVLIGFALFLLAVFGKLVGSALSAHWTGMRWREAWALGVLMNTRGLMELVVLNIGLDLGILSPEIFAMLVIMAIGTTMMTGPLLKGLKVTS